MVFLKAEAAFFVGTPFRPRERERERAREREREREIADLVCLHITGRL
jgi:hypothetical protein